MSALEVRDIPGVSPAVSKLPPRAVKELVSASGLPEEVILQAVEFSTSEGPQAGWQADGHCLGVDPDLFYPERGQLTTEAKAVCSGCCVRAECLSFAADRGRAVGDLGRACPSVSGAA